MMENITKTGTDELYSSPSIKVIHVNATGVLCQSGKDPYGEGEDFNWGN